MATARATSDRSTGWAIAKTMIFGALVALLISIAFAFAPIQNPGVQDCGTSLGYIVFDRPDLRATPGETPGSTELALQATCRERVVPQLQRAGLAFAAAIGLGMLGAMIGLIDDRVAYHRAPRFETLLRERPAEAPGRYLRSPPLVAPTAVGQALPPVEGRDVVLLGGFGLLATVAVIAMAGRTEFVSAVTGMQWMLVLLAVAVQVLAVLAASGQDLLSGGGPPRTAGTLALISAAATRLLPGLGPLGYDAFDRVWRGESRADAQRDLGSRQGLGVAGWVLLSAVFLQVARSTPRPEVEPSVWVWVLLGAGALFVLVGLGRAPDRWRRLVVRPVGLVAVVRQRRGEPGLVGPVRLVGQSAAALALPLAGVASLSLCVSAAGGRITFSGAAVLALAGMALMAITPTPGGVGAVEVTVTAGLVLFGVSPAAAALAVIVWRVVTLWLPILIGVVPLRRRSVGGPVLA